MPCHPYLGERCEAKGGGGGNHGNSIFFQSTCGSTSTCTAPTRFPGGAGRIKKGGDLSWSF